MTVVRTWLTVEVAIDGRNCRFLVDTGSPWTLLSARTAAESGIVGYSSMEIGTYNGVRASMRMAVIGRMTIGDRELAGHQVLVADDTVLDCFDIDGIIGGDILRRYVVRFSVRDGYMMLADRLPEVGEVERKHSVRMRLRNNKTYCARSYLSGIGKRHPVWLLFDTGAVGLSLAEWSRLCEKEALADLHVADGYDMSSGLLGNSGVPHTAQALAVAPKVRFAGVDIFNMPVESGRKSVIGVALLQWGDVVADYRGRRIYYVVDEDPVSAGDGAVHAMNIRPAFDVERGAVVGSVWDTGLTGSVRAGDRISHIDHTPTDSMTICDFYRMTFKPGETVLSVEANGTETHITMNIIE